ncbi:NADH dehydrogenase [ubiquinone] flavoprotein 3, mitochondrial-like [Ptychodera flava]|uniref:NADH dehydrogenase [ubiquinone] flavoprotein 3, mitochondrial-like n=1 Tax=Ptychodera flava TaxID=63121 RepID=UPI003969CB0C
MAAMQKCLWSLRVISRLPKRSFQQIPACATYCSTSQETTESKGTGQSEVPKTQDTPKTDVKTPTTESKGETYQSASYYTYNEYSFYDYEFTLNKHRIEQPSPSHK